ncbi:MAG: type II toxin-antitoxin system RelE/ParE family toxin [Alphaproteobacteria bacterium]|nr:type II toxin-antitoxin system RelE/ParE family toxin [Alphaproteobacteria bacterium]
MPPLRKTERAREDLLASWWFVAADDPAAADRLFDRIEARLSILERFPEAGTSRPDVADGMRMLAE